MPQGFVRYGGVPRSADDAYYARERARLCQSTAPPDSYREQPYRPTTISILVNADHVRNGPPPARAAASSGAKYLAQKSAGPTAVTGKAVSSRNALKTGIHARSLVLPTEKAADLDQVIDEYSQSHRPASPVARLLLDELIRCEVGAKADYCSFNSA